MTSGAKRIGRWIVAGCVMGACAAGVVSAARVHRASAQDTGGSFGGGDFGGGGGGSDFGGGGGGSDFGGGGGGSDFGGGGSAFGGGGSHFGGGGGSHFGGSGLDVGSSSSSSGSGSGAFHGSPGDGWFFFLAVIFVVAVVAILIIRDQVSSPPAWTVDTWASAPPPMRRIDVSALMVAIDWRARPFVQKRLEELARTGDVATPGGRRALLHETITLLRRAELAWVYVGVLNSRPVAPAEAEQLFRTTANDLRARFKAELVRQGDAGVVTQHGPESRARAHEGEGLVVVTVVVAAHVEIPDVTIALDRAQVDRLVQSIGAMSVSDLAALEVIWSPAADSDRMSSAELETLYRELKRLPGADALGKVFCTYCSGPFARELARCPHCGAPSAEAVRT